MTVLLNKITSSPSPYNWQENRHELSQRHNCFTPSQFNEFLYSRYYYASDTLYRIKHAKYDHKTYQINDLKQRKNKRSVVIVSTIQNRINERTESNASDNQAEPPILIERKSERRLCKPPGFWDEDKLRSISEGQREDKETNNEEIQITRTRKRKQCIIPQIKSNLQKKSCNLKIKLDIIEEDCCKE